MVEVKGTLYFKPQFFFSTDFRYAEKKNAESSPVPNTKVSVLFGFFFLVKTDSQTSAGKVDMLFL